MKIAGQSQSSQRIVVWTGSFQNDHKELWLSVFLFSKIAVNPAWAVPVLVWLIVEDPACPGWPWGVPWAIC